MSQYWVVGTGSKSQGRRFGLSAGELCVGRSPENNVVLEGRDISRVHARIFLNTEGQPCLTDSSSNGTFINGERVVGEAVLKAGDQVRFGAGPDNIFRLEAEGESRPAANAGSSSGAGAAPALSRTIVDSAETATDEFSLHLVLDQYAVRHFPFSGKRMELGSTPGDGKLLIEHPSVSPIHAALELTPDRRVQIIDQQGSNGTFVNGRRIQTSVLQDGDLIQLGQCESRLLLFRQSRGRTVELKDVELDRPVTRVGRDPSNDVPLQHPTVSNFHAEIRRQNGELTLVDKASTNGTFVNGQRVQRHVLKAGDRISVGAVQLVFNGAQFEQPADGVRYDLQARGLRVEVTDNVTGRPLTLLDNISLSIKPCEFIGLLGPSGAGKSTLMDALNGSRPSQKGHVLMNGLDLYTHFPALRSVIGYLPQEDILHRGLTVSECLYYAARLRLPDDTTERQLRERVNEVMESLELTARKNTIINELSGGQRKRVSLGIELLSNPSVLYMDEPTAGQDPRTEMKMMQLFRQIASRGSTVIINTHLLGSFALLDKTAVLVQGKLAYFGPSQAMLTYFHAQRPHEIFDRLKEQEEPEFWAEKYRKSGEFKEHVAKPLGFDAAKPSKQTQHAAASTDAPKRSAWRQLQTLVSRQFTLKFKDKANLATLLAPPVVIALLIGLMKSSPNDPKTLFMLILSALWFGCSGSVRELVDERAIYRRERQRDLKLPSYLASKLLYALPMGAAQSLLFVIVLAAFGAISGHVLGAFGVMWLMTFQGALIGLLISAIASSAEKALYVFPLAMIPQLLLAGLLMPVRPLDYISPVINDGRVEFGQVPSQFVAPAMSTPLSYLSGAMVARWGLEALADMYIRDNKLGNIDDALRNGASSQPVEQGSMDTYSLMLLNSVSVTLRPNAATETKQALVEALKTKEPPPEPDSSLAAYLGIHAVVMLFMLAAIVTAMKRRDP
jgi:ABC-type multidrug transport system ATPase subunit/pSer/pThr/pTyr-binding forkhead associated (FHA) protein